MNGQRLRAYPSSRLQRVRETDLGNLHRKGQGRALGTVEAACADAAIEAAANASAIKECHAFRWHSLAEDILYPASLPCGPAKMYP
jgi:hypothetical protein